MTHWSFNPILNSYLAVSVSTLVMALLLLIGPRFRAVSWSRRGVLIGLRIGVILLVLIAMLRPTRISTTSKVQSAVLIVMFDQSRSMQLPSSAGDQSRWQAQRAALEQVQQALQGLAEEIEVKVYAYDNELHPIEMRSGRIDFPGGPQGEQTDIGSTLSDAVQRELGQRLAGVVLLGDGAQTAFAPRVEVQQAGRELGRLAYPLYTIVFGPAGDVAQARDVAIENMPERYTVFVKNELVVKGLVRVQGYVNQNIPVELAIEDPRGQQRVLGPKPVTAHEDGQQLPVEILFVPAEPGQYKLTLRAAEQPGELVTRNNELSGFLTVLEGGLRVIYLYGDLLGEQRLLRKSVNMSPDIQLDDQFLDPRNRDRWPVDLGDLLDERNFDVLLIENVDASALGEANLKVAATAVEQGRGLMMIGGFSSFGPGGYQGTPLADVLPIEMGRFERQDVGYDRPISRDLHHWGDLQMLPTAPHPVTRLAPDEENLQVWKSLPALKGANKVDVKPSGRVLAETADRVPLLVAGEYGQGRVLAFAGNSTIRWWQYGHQAEHRRFWRQVILWLARRDDLDQHDVWIKLEQRRYHPGARVTFTAGAKSATGDVIRDADFLAEIVWPDKNRTPIRLSADGEHMTGTSDELKQPGDYLIELKANKNGRLLGTARASFQVLDRDVELSNPAAGHDQMARLANWTKDAGGKSLAPEQLPALLRELKERRPELEVEVQSKWQLADTALDAWLFLLCLVGLLAGEWALRKKWGLV